MIQFASYEPYSYYRRLITILLAACFCCAGMAHADPQSQSYSSWKLLEGSILARYTIATREVTRLLASGSISNNAASIQLAEHLEETVSVFIEGEECPAATNPVPRTSSAAYMIMELRFDCAKAAEFAAAEKRLSIRIATLFDAAPSHIHFARFKVSGDRQLERLFTRQTPQRQISFVGASGQPASAPKVEGMAKTLQSYTVLGFQHILEGLDHIVFLLALLLLSTKLRDVLLIVTGFTVGHSITLSLAVLEIVQPNIAMVESIIGLTIALVAIENIAVLSPYRRAIIVCTTLGLLLAALPSAFGWRQHAPPAVAVLGLALMSMCYLLLSSNRTNARRFRPIVTLVFGLVHGFGFANVLQEVGLPDDRVLPALLGFNIGVEFGQVAIVAALSLMFIVARRVFNIAASDVTASKHFPAELLSAGLCSLGVYWFIQRAYF